MHWRIYKGTNLITTGSKDGIIGILIRKAKPNIVTKSVLTNLKVLFYSIEL